MLFRSGHNQPVCSTHFPVQKAHGVLLVVVGTEGIGADHFTQISRAVREGFDLGAHLVDDDFDACVGGLPSGLGASHAAANNVKYISHLQRPE